MRSHCTLRIFLGLALAFQGAPLPAQNQPLLDPPGTAPQAPAAAISAAGSPALSLVEIKPGTFGTDEGKRPWDDSDFDPVRNAPITELFKSVAEQGGRKLVIINKVKGEINPKTLIRLAQEVRPLNAPAVPPTVREVYIVLMSRFQVSDYLDREVIYLSTGEEIWPDTFLKDEARREWDDSAFDPGRNAPIADIFRSLAEQGGHKIVVSDKVKGEINPQTLIELARDIFDKKPVLPPAPPPDDLQPPPPVSPPPPITVREVYITLLGKFQALDYFDQSVIHLSAGNEKKTALIAEVSAGLNSKLTAYLVDGGFYPKERDFNKVALPRGIFLGHTPKHTSLLLQGPPRFVELVKVLLDGLKGDVPDIEYGFRRVHCRHALVNQRTFAAMTYGTELVVPGVFELMRSVLGDSKPGSLVYNPSVVFAEAPPPITTGGPDGSGLQNTSPQVTTREILTQSIAANAARPLLQASEFREERALDRVETAVQQAITRQTLITQSGGSVDSALSALGVENRPRLAEVVNKAKTLFRGTRDSASGAKEEARSSQVAAGPEVRQPDENEKGQKVPPNRLSIVNDIARETENNLADQSISGNDPYTPLLPLPDRASFQEDAPVALGPTPGGHYGKLGETFDVLGAKATSSQTVITADTRTNSIFIFGPKDMLNFYEEMVKALDFPQLLVEISAAVVDVNAESTFEWNSRIAGRVKGEIQDKTAALGGGFDSDGLDLFKNLAAAGGPALTGPLVDNAGLNVAGLLVGESYQILAQFRALEQIGQARIVSRPSVMTLDNVLAALTESTRFYVPVQGKEDARLYEIKAETKIKVHPHLVFPDEDIEPSTAPHQNHRPTRVRLLIDIEDGVPSSTLSTTTPTLGPDGTTVAQTIPAVVNSRINTQGEVEDGQSLLIGGRYRNEQTDRDGHVPILGKIPVLGLPFKGKSVVQRRVQRMFIITPRIVDPARQTRLAKEQMEAVMKSWSSPPHGTPKPAREGTVLKDPEPKSPRLFRFPGSK